MKSEKKKFNDIYNEIIIETKEFFETLKKLQVRNFTIAVVVAVVLSIIIMGVNRQDFMLFVPLAICIVFVAVFFSNLHYRKSYKEVIIGKLVRKYSDKLTYYQDGTTITNSDYYQAGFDRNWDEIVKEDGVSGSLDDGSHFRMAQLTTYKRKKYLDENGHVREERIKLYKGTFCVVSLKKFIMNQIEIMGNARKYKYNKNRIEIDSETFEKEFDLIAKDRVQALRIFTPEIIEAIVDLKERIKVNFRVRIEGDKLYIKIDTGDIFEPISYKAELSATALLEYYNTVDIPVTLANTIIKGAAEL